MSEKRRFILYSYGNDRNSHIVDTEDYEFTTLAHERQLADELAAKHNLRLGEGHIAVCDDKGVGINKLRLEP